MEAILYAEIYFVCMIFATLLLTWTSRSDTRSNPEVWLMRLLASFLLNFTSNFLFTLFNRVFVIADAVVFLSYLFKTLYFLTLVIGVYCWCGYAEAVLGNNVLDKGQYRTGSILLLCIGLSFPIINLFTHWMFNFSETLAYHRYFLFHAELIFLFVASFIPGFRLLKNSSRESTPALQSHLRLTAAFPLCILAADIFSYLGEAIPVICICVIVELQCIYMGNTRRQISLDPLTQVNNRQNLIGFMEFRLKNHADTLYLLMIDLNFFKTINDTYGHLAGDHALVQLSSVLKRSCAPIQKRPYIARYGGDEFIIIMEGSEEEMHSLCDSIHATLEEINRKSSTYRLEVSIGVSLWKDGMDSKAFIADADEDLYKKKRALGVHR